MKQKWVFAFEEGDGKNKMLLGGKGANLCEMTQIGLNVPPGFTISRLHHRKYFEPSCRDLPAVPGISFARLRKPANRRASGARPARPLHPSTQPASEL